MTLASTGFLFGKYSFHDSGYAVVFLNIPDNIFFGIPEAVTDKVFHLRPMRAGSNTTEQDPEEKSGNVEWKLHEEDNSFK